MQGVEPCVYVLWFVSGMEDFLYTESSLYVLLLLFNHAHLLF